MRLPDGIMRERVSAARIARLATLRTDGRPHLVPITFALVGDRIVHAVDHKPKTTTNLQRLRNIEANPAAAVIVDHYDDDWTQLWWVRTEGTARIVRDGPEHEEAIVELAEKYEPYRAQRPSGPVIVLDIAAWSSWAP